MSVATCPHCEGQVTLPPGARPAARVKCPLCEAEYALSEIYEKLPPMLVLLEAPVEAEVVAGSGVSHGASAFDSLFMPSGEANGEGELHLAGDEEPAFDFGAPSEGGTAVAAAPSTKTLPTRAKRPPKSAMKEGIKIVLGGIVGLTIGYFILLWAAGRDLADDVANKPIGTVMPSWMQWSLPAAHRHPKPAATNDNPPAEDQGASADENASDANVADEGAADGDATPNDAPKDDAPKDDTSKDDTSGDTATDAPGDATPNPETPTDSPKPDDMPPSDAPADTPSDEGSPGEAKPEAKPEATPPKTPANTPPTEDPGLNVGPKPEFHVEEPKLDPLPGDPPSDAPKPDEPKTDEPKVDEPPADTPPADMPPADAPEDNPFDIKPDETPKPDDAPKSDPPVVDPADTPDVVPSDKPDDQPKDKPADEPKEPEPSKPAAGLKVDTPVDEAAIGSARSAASGALDTLMPSDAAAKAGFTREKYASYTKLCEYAQGVSHSAADVAATNAEAAKMMVLMVAADDADNRVLGQLANAWLSKTRANDGIALSGKVTAVDTAGGLTTITVELPALGDKLAARTATIVTRETTDVAAGDEVAAVGSVVDKPTEKIEGYAGADAQVIWGAWVGKRSGS